MELLLAEAIHAATEIEQARKSMASAASRRKAALRALRDGGMSIRAIAQGLGTSPRVVQGLLRD